MAVAVLYWELDGGGSAARVQAQAGQADFAFPQQAEPRLAAPGWQPLFTAGGYGRPVIRVILAEDSFIVREGLREILGRRPGIEVASAHADLGSLMAAVEADPPDVVLTDIRMPPTRTDEGIQVASGCARPTPDTGVIILSQYSEPAYVLELLGPGSDGRGYLLKERVHDRDQLMSAIDAVAARRLADRPEDRRGAGGRPVAVGAVAPAAADRARARGPGRDRVGQEQQRDRRVAGADQAGGGEAHQLDLHEARPGRGRGREQARHGHPAVSGADGTAAEPDERSLTLSGDARKSSRYGRHRARRPRLAALLRATRSSPSRFPSRLRTTSYRSMGSSVDAMRLVDEDLALDGDPQRNLATFVTTWMEPEAQRLIAENLHRNFIDHAEYPRTAEIEQRCIRMLADLFHAPGETTGARCQGSSEAIMLGALSLKWKWTERREAAGKADRPAQPDVRRRRARGLGEVLPLLRRGAADRPLQRAQVHDRPRGRGAAPGREHDRRGGRAGHHLHRPHRTTSSGSTTCWWRRRTRTG